MSYDYDDHKTRWTSFDPPMRSSLESKYPSKKSCIIDPESKKAWEEEFYRVYKYRTDAINYMKSHNIKNTTNYYEENTKNNNLENEDDDGLKLSSEELSILEDMANDISPLDKEDYLNAVKELKKELKGNSRRK